MSVGNFEVVCVVFFVCFVSLKKCLLRCLGDIQVEVSSRQLAILVCNLEDRKEKREIFGSLQHTGGDFIIEEDAVTHPRSCIG